MAGGEPPEGFVRMQARQQQASLARMGTVCTLFQWACRRAPAWVRYLQLPPPQCVLVGARNLYVRGPGPESKVTPGESGGRRRSGAVPGRRDGLARSSCLVGL